jgi:hypothetical protein
MEGWNFRPTTVDTELVFMSIQPLRRGMEFAIVRQMVALYTQGVIRYESRLYSSHSA